MANAVLLFANNASANLASNITSGQTSITLATGYGALFPLPVAGQQFKIVLDNQRTGDFEVCNVTARSGDILTVSRGAEQSVAKAFAAADTVVQLRLTKETMEQSFETSQGAIGPIGLQGVPGSSNIAVTSANDATRDFVAADVGKTVLYTSSNAGDVWTMQPATAVVGDTIRVCYRGGGQDLTINAGVGVTFYPSGTASSTSVVMTTINEILKFYQIETDGWVLSND